MCVQARRGYTADARTAAAARRFGEAFVIATIRPDGWHLSDDTALVISELVTDAVKAQAAAIDVDVEIHVDRVEIVVTDDRRSERQAVADDSTRRSRQILDSITFGTEFRPAVDHHTSVWAQLRCDPALTEHIACKYRA
jgi:hypothetical protein